MQLDDGGLMNFGPALRYTSYHFRRLECRVVIDWEDDTVMLFQPYYRGGKMVLAHQDYIDFDGIMAEWVRFLQERYRERVKAVRRTAESSGLDERHIFTHYPHDVGVMEGRLGISQEDRDERSG